MKLLPENLINPLIPNIIDIKYTTNKTAIKLADIAEKLKSEKYDVAISEIILRTDKPDLNKKGNEVNTHFCNKNV